VDLTDLDAVIAWHKATWGEDVERDDDGLYSWTTYNPQSKWDWYQIGGRWSGLLILLDGSTVDQARKGDIDWAATNTAQHDGRFSTYATLAEGIWKEPGKMGWFASTTATDETQAAYNRWQDMFIAGAPDETLLTIVDC